MDNVRLESLQKRAMSVLPYALSFSCRAARIFLHSAGASDVQSGPTLMETDAPSSAGSVDLPVLCAAEQPNNPSSVGMQGFRPALVFPTSTAKDVGYPTKAISDKTCPQA